VNAFFSGDDNTAYVLNCGAECGGVQAGVQTLDLNSDTLGTLVAACTPDVPVVCSGSEALLDGTTMYLAGIPFNSDGTPFAQPCTGETTAATSCGLLTVVDLTSMTVTKSRIVITDGFHNRIALGANGQLFVGARTCTEIIPPIPVPPNAETRGCLSIYDTQTSAVVIPPANGDVTGIQPISGRHVVYAAQGGEIQIYDTTTDKLQNTQIDVSGEVIDVKTVDFLSRARCVSESLTFGDSEMILRGESVLADVFAESLLGGAILRNHKLWHFSRNANQQLGPKGIGRMPSRQPAGRWRYGIKCKCDRKIFTGNYLTDHGQDSNRRFTGDFVFCGGYDYQ